ncbi:phosphoglycerate kinase [Patescibacteria group bacterium]
MRLQTLNDLGDVAGRRVMVRVDYNVPISGGKIGADEDARIRASLPTVRDLIQRKAQVILVSHLGRPKKRDRKHSLRPVAERLAKLMRRKVRFVSAPLYDDDRVDRELANLKAGQVALLENVRFYPGEGENDSFLARRLASLADVFVNDAFATAHRTHASNVGVTKHLDAFAGKIMEAEIHNLNRLLKDPRKPFVVLMGGAKISSKLPTLERLLKASDKILIGGGMANSFFRAKGLSTGKSAVPRDDVVRAKKLLKKRKLMLPIDVVAASSMTKQARVRVCKPDEVDDDEYVLDIGPATIMAYAQVIRTAQTLAWNGPMGLFEVKKFSHGTVALGRLIAARSTGRAFGVVGGGETIVALERTGMKEHVDHVSTGGGAMLEFLAGKTLPGIEPLIR